ncbi:MAG: hypothetical protein AB7N24_14300 [Dehalococcoidia bacterium]
MSEAAFEAWLFMDEGFSPANRITRRRFDADDVGTEVAKQLRRENNRFIRQIDDGDPCQRKNQDWVPPSRRIGYHGAVAVTA